MSDLCGELDPGTGQACHREGNHPTHIAGFGRKRVSWENPGWNPPPQYQPKVPDGKKKLGDMADRVEPEDRAAKRDASIAAGRDAQVRVDAAADPEWKARAREAITRVARRQEFLLADDVWDEGLDRPSESRAMGPIFTWAARQGLIVSTEDFTSTSMLQGHGGPRRIWRSLVFTPQDPDLIDFG